MDGMVHNMDEFYFPEHYCIMRYDQLFGRSPSWFVYNTRLMCEESRISVRFVRKLLKDGRIKLHREQPEMNRASYVATDYEFFRVSALPSPPPNEKGLRT